MGADVFRDIIHVKEIHLNGDRLVLLQQVIQFLAGLFNITVVVGLKGDCTEFGKIFVYLARLITQGYGRKGHHGII